MKKIFFTLAMLLTFGQGAWAETIAPAVVVMTSDALHAAVRGNGAEIILGADVSIGSLLDIKNVTVTLDLNGHTLTRTSAESDKRNGQVIWVESNANLTIKDTASGGKITGGYAINGGGIWNDGTLTIEGGIITGNKVVDENGVDGRGGGIFNKAGAMLTITGGSITCNEAVGNAHGGAGIFNDGTFVMTGGSVTNNSATHGGGIMNYGTFTLKGGYVTENRSSSYGGGIWNDGTLNMEGNPTVINNDLDDLYLFSGIINCTGSLTGEAQSIGINMEKPGVFTSNYSNDASAVHPFFASIHANEIYHDTSNNQFWLQMGYYKYSWDEEKKDLVRTLEHVPVDAIYLTGGKNANIGEGKEESLYVVHGTVTYTGRVWCKNKVNIVLCDGAHLKVEGGLKVRHEDHAELRIFTQSYGPDMGKLTADSSHPVNIFDNFGAGIGADSGEKVGTIEIHGGSIYARGDNNSAGIGGAEDADGGTLIVYQGVVEAHGGSDGAGIGGGEGGGGGTIRICGGTVDSEGGNNSAGIGGGKYQDGGGSGGSITIDGGLVVAQGGWTAAGIGGGLGDQTHNEYCNSGDIIINGGTVISTGGTAIENFGGGAGIGGGFLGRVGSITITGGVVTAQGYDGGAGIGSGNSASQIGHITISGGDVTAHGGNADVSSGEDALISGGAGIGSGGTGRDITSLGNITLSGGRVRAFGGKGSWFFPSYGGGGAGIGCGGDGIVYNTSFITISGANVEATGGLSSGEDSYDGAGIGGGYKCDGANVIITAGTVTANGYSAIGQGASGNNLSHRNLSLPDSYSVLGGADASSATLKAFADREDGSRDKYALVEPCSHSSQTTYAIIDGSTHTVSCIYCGSTSEAHTFGGNGVCDACDLVSLPDNIESTGVIEYWKGTERTVTLTDRKLWKDGTWNTLCLPFAVSNFTGTPLEGATVKTLENASFNTTDGTLMLNFTNDNLTAIEAGKPYIVKWTESTPGYIENPVFQHVTISDEVHPVATNAVIFKGQYSPMSIKGKDKMILYLRDDNMLYYPNDAMEIGAFRAYFLLKGIIVADK